MRQPGDHGWRAIDQVPTATLEGMDEPAEDAFTGVQSRTKLTDCMRELTVGEL